MDYICISDKSIHSKPVSPNIFQRNNGDEIAAITFKCAVIDQIALYDQKQNSIVEFFQGQIQKPRSYYSYEAEYTFPV